MKKIVVIVIILCLLTLAGITITYFLQSNKTIAIKPIEANAELKTPAKNEKGELLVVKPVTFCLYKTLPIYGEDVIRVLKNGDASFDNSLLEGEGIRLSFSELAPYIELKKSGCLRISNDTITFDHIDSFLAGVYAASGFEYIEFKEKNDQEYNKDDIYVINIDNNYLAQHKVTINNITEFSDSTLEEGIFNDIKSYFETNKKDPYFISEENDLPDLKQKIIKNYKLKLYQITEIPVGKFFIASFEPNINDYPFTNFSLFYMNNKVDKFGFRYDFKSFKIDDQLYFGFINCVTPGSGYVGKELYSYKRDSWELVVGDYSQAD